MSLRWRKKGDEGKGNEEEKDWEEKGEKEKEAEAEGGGGEIKEDPINLRKRSIISHLMIN